MPMGLQKWKILDDQNCKDGDGDLKSISLHINHEMPGKFCCNNGLCIDSELGKQV